MIEDPAHRHRPAPKPTAAQSRSRDSDSAVVPLPRAKPGRVALVKVRMLVGVALVGSSARSSCQASSASRADNQASPLATTAFQCAPCRRSVLRGAREHLTAAGEDLDRGPAWRLPLAMLSWWVTSSSTAPRPRLLTCPAPGRPAPTITTPGSTAAPCATSTPDASDTNRRLGS
jgi:hypothetical protein